MDAKVFYPQEKEQKVGPQPGGVQILNAIAHSANFSDYLCIYKLIISLCEVYNDGNCLPPKAGQNTTLSVDLVP